MPRNLREVAQFKRKCRASNIEITMTIFKAFIKKAFKTLGRP